MPLVNSLELSASARYEHYSDFGNTTKPKVGANWRPVAWLMLRGSYNEGFMAPEPRGALHEPALVDQHERRGRHRSVPQSVPRRGPYVMRTYFGGNPDLKPQESEGTTFGFVLDVPGVEGLSA